MLFGISYFEICGFTLIVALLWFGGPRLPRGAARRSAMARYRLIGGTIPPGVPQEAIPGLWRAQRSVRFTLLAILSIGAIAIAVGVVAALS